MKFRNEKRSRSSFFLCSMNFYRRPWNKILGAGNESRTRDLNLGKVALYQLSYSRVA